MVRRFWWILFILMVVPVQAQDSIANQILNAVNTARMDVGASQLVFNGQLLQAAQRHSNDMAANTTLSHVGTDGSQFFERIQQAGYPLTTGAENVLSRGDNDAMSAFLQWYNSPPHQANMLNPDFQEIGIAYTQGANGQYYFTMVLAARLDFVAPTIAPTNTLPPPTAMPSATPIHPTNTPIPTQTVLPTRTIAPTDVRLATILAPLPTNTAAPTQIAAVPAFDATNTPIPTATTVPQPDIRLIYDDTSLMILNVSGRSLNLSNLIFESASGALLADEWDTEFLTQSLTSFTDGDCLQVWGLETDFVDKPNDCDVRHAWIVVNAVGQFWRNVDTFTVRNGTNPVGICSGRATTCDINLTTIVDRLLPQPAIATQAATDLRLVYNFNSLTLINVSGRTLDLTGLTFRSDGGTMSVSKWDTQFLTQPLTSFRSGGCLQVWGLDAAQIYPAPATCDVRHAWIAVGDAFDFWRNTTRFTVERGTTRLANCSINNNICEVSLNANLGTTTQPDQQTTTQSQALTTGFDMRVQLEGDGFTLINTSGRTLNLTGLAFESDTGVFVASRWQSPDLSRPLSAFPAGGCLQTWDVLSEFKAPPSDCATRHAWVTVGADAQFWNAPRVFRVRQGATVLQTCETRANLCDFNIP